MFASIDLRGLKTSPLFGYAASVPFYKRRKQLEFKPGLNILFGPNGCGKSTALNILAKTMAAEQGGRSAVTESFIHETVDMLGALPNPRSGARKDMADKIALTVEHDGQPVLYCDPRKSVGLQGGAFDNDFFASGVVEVTQNRRLSHGLRSLARANAALGVLAGTLQFPPDILHGIKKQHVNDTWGLALDIAHARLKPTLEKGQPTVLLDEPEANLSLLAQAQLWKLLSAPSVAQQFQVIVASHSPFALGIEHANYIEFEKGYVQETLAHLQERFSRPTPV